MTAIGAMAMPCNFRYEKTYRMGRPQHKKFDDFWRRHIPMDPGHRAKIFSPFDALAEFDEAIASKEVLYEKRKTGNRDELNKKLSYLEDYSSPVAVSYFVPCEDINNAAFNDGRGTYKTITGIVNNVDATRETLQIAGMEISFEDIRDIDFGW